MGKVDSELKVVLETGKEKGFLTYEEFNELMPDEDPEKLDDILMTLDEHGIELIEVQDGRKNFKYVTKTRY